MARLTAPGPRVACLATQGSDSNDERRIRSLLAPLHPTVIPFDRGRKGHSALAVLSTLRRERPDVVVMEGTGLAGGLALLVARALARVPYVVSSGDAVGPFIAAHRPWLKPIAGGYERLLCSHAAGFIGWSPYLAGRALTFGAPRAMTAPGWADGDARPAADARAAARRRFGIPEDALVFGIVGSLSWSPRVGYCYGAELVRAARRTHRDDLRILVIGDGSGRPHLERMAGEMLGSRVILPGRIPRNEVMAALAAMDVGSLPQSVDGVGAFRYTTKISEYLAARVPVVTGQIPLAYDLDGGWLWRLPGEAPWDETYLGALAQMMDTLTLAEVAARREAVPHDAAEFNEAAQRRRVCDFVRDLVSAR